VSVFAAGASDHNWINSDLIASGGNHAGDGGDGYSMAASFTHLSHCIIRSTLRWLDTTLAPMLIRQTM